ncbi:MAG: protein-L-isoaspartate(D-aspartate) O-methyltransferase [Bacteroidales bacterium]
MRTHRILISFIILFCISLNTSAQSEQTRQRKKMVREQIRARGIEDESTLEAFLKVPRHIFVPNEYKSWAYSDRPLPIGYGQTISQPYIVAYMTEIIEPEKNHKVLEIGTGSGYQAAILAEIVDQVYTIEIIPELGELSKKILEENYDNVSVKIADGFYGWEEKGPFDAIIVTAAAEYIPPPLIKQLKEDGKMIIPVGSMYMVQQLILVEKSEGEILTQNLMPVKFVPFTRSDK